jgi:hypothetical protein
MSPLLTHQFVGCFAWFWPLSVYVSIAVHLFGIPLLLDNRDMPFDRIVAMAFKAMRLNWWMALIYVFCGSVLITVGFFVFVVGMIPVMGVFLVLQIMVYARVFGLDGSAPLLAPNVVPSASAPASASAPPPPAPVPGAYPDTPAQMVSMGALGGDAGVV